MNLIKKYSLLKELAEFLEKQDYVTDPEEKIKILDQLKSELVNDQQTKYKN